MCEKTEKGSQATIQGATREEEWQRECAQEEKPLRPFLPPCLRLQLPERQTERS